MSSFKQKNPRKNLYDRHMTSQGQANNCLSLFHSSGSCPWRGSPVMLVAAETLRSRKKLKNTLMSCVPWSACQSKYNFDLNSQAKPSFSDSSNISFSQIGFESLQFFFIKAKRTTVKCFRMPDPDSENSNKIPIFVENKLFTTAFAS